MVGLLCLFGRLGIRDVYQLSLSAWQITLKFRSLKTKTNICYLTVSVGQQFRKQLSQVILAQYLMRLYWRCYLKAWLWLEDPLPRGFTHMTDRRLPFLTLSVSQKAGEAPSQWGSRLPQKQGVQERVRQSDNVFNDLASKGTCYHICYIPLVTKINPDTIWEETTQGMNTKQHPQ